MLPPEIFRQPWQFVPLLLSICKICEICSRNVHKVITLRTYTRHASRDIMISQGKMYSSFFMIVHLHLSADTVSNRNHYSLSESGVFFLPKNGDPAKNRCAACKADNTGFSIGSLLVQLLTQACSCLNQAWDVVVISLTASSFETASSIRYKSSVGSKRVTTLPFLEMRNFVK